MLVVNAVFKDKLASNIVVMRLKEKLILIESQKHNLYVQQEIRMYIKKFLKS